MFFDLWSFASEQDRSGPLEAPCILCLARSEADGLILLSAVWQPLLYWGRSCLQLPLPPFCGNQRHLWTAAILSSPPTRAVAILSAAASHAFSLAIYYRESQLQQIAAEWLAALFGSLEGSLPVIPFGPFLCVRRLQSVRPPRGHTPSPCSQGLIYLSHTAIPHARQLLSTNDLKQR